MASVNVSSFLNTSFDWQTMVDKLVEVDSAPKVKLQAEQQSNTAKISALAEIKSAILDLQGSVQAMWNSDLYNARSVSSDVTGSTWKSSSSAGAALGSHVLAVTQLATAARLDGAADIGAGLTGATVATLNSATAVTAGDFYVNGCKVTVSATDSLAQVLEAIGAATGGAVGAAYDSGTDKIKLTSAAPIMVGSGKDTSNFLVAMGLTNSATFSSGTYTAASRSSLGRLKPAAPLESAGFRTAVAGTGSFALNGVTISYNAAVDSLADVVKRINASGAGVKASYDAGADRVVLLNNSTGDLGISVGSDTGGLLAALGLTGGATFVAGKNAEYSVDGGPTQYSLSNTLDATALGITGLSVTVNSATTQTIGIATDATALHAAIESFVAKYNVLQALLDNTTRITAAGGTVSTSVLSDNREAQAWGTKIRALAFEAVSSATGSVKRLNDLGLDFDSNTGELAIKSSAKLSDALLNSPGDVAAFFQTGSTGFASKLHTYLSSALKADGDTQSRLGQSNIKIDSQIADIQRHLDSERAQLTAAFQKMQDAQAKAQSQNTYLTNTFFKGSS